MGKRNYQVYFNTHTVSGIVISVALYVIFFAGAFALFKDEIGQWEKGTQSHYISRDNIDFDSILTHLEDSIGVNSRDLQFNLGHHSDEIFVMMGEAKSEFFPEDKKAAQYFGVDITTYELSTYEETYGLGEFLFRLHFFSQIPYIGIYLAGFVSLFFLFAIVTGVIIHWKQMISKFYVFNPKQVLKRLWTDAHTSLGLIGLPFQLIYAVTGAYFGLSILVLIPANMLYNSDQDKLMADLRPEREVIEWIEEAKEDIPSLNEFVTTYSQSWENFNLQRVIVKNYNGVNMKYLLVGEYKDSHKWLSSGRISKDVFNNQVTIDKNPDDGQYKEDIQRSVGRLHFGDFGGVWVKVLYFTLALVTCFVILTGVLIWIESRNKKNISLKQRAYTTKVGHTYLGMCLSLFPVTAFSFLLVKYLPESWNSSKMFLLYICFFTLWIGATFFYRWKRNNYLTNKSTLLIGGILGLLIPLSNGFVSGHWMWKMYKLGQYEILTIDLLWTVLSIMALFIAFKINPNITEKSSYNKLPLDYKAAKESKESVVYSSLNKNEKSINKNHIPMRSKIVILWIFLGLGWVIHHIYGLFNIYYNETLIMEGATGEAPVIHHIYRILFEGICLLLGLLTIEVSKPWFRKLSFVWICIAGLYNVYHCITALIYEPSNISEIFMLVLMVVASAFLFKNIRIWMKDEE